MADSAQYATIPGGFQNTATTRSYAAGTRAKASHTGAFVWADGQDADFASTSTNQFNVRASGGVRLETSGAGVTVDGQPVVAGQVNASQIADGAGSGLDADVLDGFDSSAFWKLGGNAGITPGIHFLGTTDDQPLEFKVNNQTALRLQPNSNGYPNLIGGVSNAVGTDVDGATVAGGYLHAVGNGANAPTIGGGFLNNIQGGGAATISGGAYNTNTSGANGSAIGGGSYHRIQAAHSTIAGGFVNSIRQGASYSTIGGGDSNIAQTNSTYATISGGGFNVIGVNADYATVPGGVLNQAGGDLSFAAGFRAKANHRGAFVWADSQNADFNSTTSNQFNVRASGGVRLETSGAGVTVDGQPVLAGQVNAAQLADGAVTAAKLAASSVTSTAIATGAVDTARLADGAVTAAKVLTAAFASPLLTLTNPTPNIGDQFGAGVVVIGPERILVGAHADDTGANNAGVAHLLDLAGTLLLTLTNPAPAASDQFAQAIGSVGNDKILIGAALDDSGDFEVGSAYLYNLAGTLLTTFTNPTPSAYDVFGFALAGMGGDKVLIGAPGDDTGATNTGAVYLFNIGGTLLTTITNPFPANGGGFGATVAAFGTDKFLIGSSSATSGPLGAGAAYLFDLNGSLLATFNNPNPSPDHSFSASVAAVGADKVLIGAFRDDASAANAGAAYLFGLDGTLLTTFTNPTPTTFELFGRSVADAGSGMVLIGCPNDTITGISGGAVYLFDLSGRLVGTVTNSNAQAGSSFGSAVSMLGADRILVGAPLDNTGVSDAGAVHLFSLSTYAPGLVSDGVRPGSITSASLVDATVTSAKLADGAALAELLDDDGAGSGLDADLLDGFDSSAFWKLSGNNGTTAGTHFLGTSDNQPLELKVNGVRALRLEPTATTPNLIGGYSGNSAAASVDGGVIGGGGSSGGANQIEADYTTIGGGLAHGIQTTAHYATISGGRQNTVQTNAQYSAIGGGYLNTVFRDSQFSFIGGGYRNYIQTNASYATIAGGYSNTNSPQAHYSTIGGGLRNVISNDCSSCVIGGGQDNRIDAAASWSTIAGGVFNTNGFASQNAAIGGGWRNSIRTNAHSSVIAGGYWNAISNNSSYGVIAGGQENRIDGGAWYATIAGGFSNRASGYFSFAGGRRAKAVHGGALVWADSQDSDFASTAIDQVSFRCNGGVRFTSGSGALNQTVSWTPGNASWTFPSDRNLKESVTPVDAQAVLEKVARLPVNEWKFKGHDQRHIGPMAQDFHAAFPLNENETQIDSGDLHGVALAAIQGLNKKLEQELQARDAEIGELKRAVSEMKQLIQGLAAQRREGQ